MSYILGNAQLLLSEATDSILQQEQKTKVNKVINNSFVRIYSQNEIKMMKEVEASVIAERANHQYEANTSKRNKLYGNKAFTPRTAIIMSATFPGLGQAYNLQYWKIPLAWAAVGIPIGFLIYNDVWYKRCAFAFNVVATNDTNNFPNINPKLKGLSASSLQYYRNAFRQDRDYSILFLLIGYALNIVDATVSAHLKTFNVTDNLSFKIKPKVVPNLMGNSFYGAGLVFDIHSRKEKIRKLELE
ncbi:MAG: DUF5683 domain-containing protein [Phycisphaerales bacterium]|nr:DUF5683 domain-containing protein [Phycisphaerales bacterium]